MTAALLALALCAPASAQYPAPPADKPAASTGTAPSPPPVVDLSSGAAPAPAPEPAPKVKEGPSIPSNPLRAKIHKEAADWEPVSVTAGGSAAATKTGFSWKLKKKGKTHVGKTSKAKAMARVYPAGDDQSLVVSVFPKEFEAQRTHIELRYLLVEGFLEKVEVSAVTAEEGGGPLDDARMLRAAGIGFQEESPAGGSLKVAAIDAKPGKAALNVGALKLAEFSESDLNPRSLGLTSADYSVRGVGGPEARAGEAAARPKARSRKAAAVKTGAASAEDLQAWSEAKLALGRLQGALSQYYADTGGKYPTSLDGLVPKYIDAVLELNLPQHKRTRRVTIINDPKGDSPAPWVQDTGGWLYFTGDGAKLDGTLLIDCTHPDAKGKPLDGL